MNKNFIIFVFAFLFLMANVSALGVTPGRTTIDFVPGEEKEIGFSIINSEHKNMNLVIYAQGELNQSISLSANSLSMGSAEESKQLTYKIKVPSDLKPGLHIAEIVVLQLPEKSQTTDAYVGSAIAVITQLYINVPYPGKYAEAEFNVINAEQNEEATFVIPVINRGKLDLVDVKANIDIYNKVNEKVGSFNTASISLTPNERKEIVATWKANVQPGTYRAVATLIYDESITQLERQFNIGNAVLDLQQIEVGNFALGDIAKFEMLVENKWSEPIRNAYSQTEVFGNDGQVIADYKSPTYDIDPFTKKLMVSYWDTAGVGVGIYEASIYLKYGDKSSRKNVQFKVSDDEIEVIGLGFVISENNSSKDGGNGLTVILITGIVILVLINIIWFLVLRKKLKKK